jgi:hypothetical protein
MQIYKIYDLDGYTGEKTPGVRKGTLMTQTLQEPTPTHVLDEDAGMEDEADDAEQGDIGSLVNYITSLAT